MTCAGDKRAALLDYVQADGRICPKPDRWNSLWEMLPGRQPVGAGWSPPPPLILAGWWYSSDADKQLRLREHIDYAAAHGALESVDHYLRDLGADQWHTIRDK